jgi:hypothetical protein
LKKWLESKRDAYAKLTREEAAKAKSGAGAPKEQSQRDKTLVAAFNFLHGKISRHKGIAVGVSIDNVYVCL